MGAETTTIPTKAAENVLMRPEMGEIGASMDMTAVRMKDVGYMPLEVNIGMSGVGADKYYQTGAQETSYFVKVMTFLSAGLFISTEGVMQKYID